MHVKHQLQSRSQRGIISTYDCVSHHLTVKMNTGVYMAKCAHFPVVEDSDLTLYGSVISPPHISLGMAYLAHSTFSSILEWFHWFTPIISTVPSHVRYETNKGSENYIYSLEMHGTYDVKMFLRASHPTLNSDVYTADAICTHRTRQKTWNLLYKITQFITNRNFAR